MATWHDVEKVYYLYSWALQAGENQKGSLEPCLQTNDAQKNAMCQDLKDENKGDVKP